jgi:hypothetical protein
MVFTIGASRRQQALCFRLREHRGSRVDYVARRNEVRVTDTITVTETSTATEFVTVPIPFPASSCPDYLSTGRSPWAVHSNLNISGTPGQWIGMEGVSTREE